MTEEINLIDSVNKEILKSFKSLQRNKNILYTAASDEYLTSINDKSMIIYDNAIEVDFEGTYKLTRNKLIPVDDYILDTKPSDITNLSNFKKIGDFGKNTDDLQKFCYDKNIRINLIEIFESLEQLISVYKYYSLYMHNDKKEVMFVFINAKHKTYLLSKLI